MVGMKDGSFSSSSDDEGSSDGGNDGLPVSGGGNSGVLGASECEGKLGMSVGCLLLVNPCRA